MSGSGSGGVMKKDDASHKNSALKFLERHKLNSTDPLKDVSSVRVTAEQRETFDF